MTTVEELIHIGALAPPIDGNHGEIHPKSSDFVSSGVPFIMASDLKGGRVDIKNCAFITKDQASSLRKGFAKAGDVLLSHKATLGRTALVGPSEHDFLMLTPQVTYYRVLDSTRINNRYLKYYFDTEPFQSTLAAWAGAGSTRAYIGITAQRKLPIVLPPIQIQDGIAEILGAIDDRITLLRETNATLEAIAQALFKSWFVDFEPVRAKCDGRAPDGMDESTAALFPDSFENSEFGEVPRGWNIGSIASLMKLHKGVVNPGSAPEKWFQHFSLPAYDDGQTPVLQQGTEIKSNKTSIPASAVLLSKLNPHIPRVWLPSSVNAEAVCSTEFLVFVPTPVSTTNFVYSLLSTPDFCSRLCQLVTGTSNSHQRVKPDSVLCLPQVLPNTECIRAYDAIVDGLYARLKLNRETSRNLAALRDALLPRLISGQLRLPEAAEAIEPALA